MMVVTIAGAVAVFSYFGAWIWNCGSRRKTQKQANEQLIEAYYQRVIYLGHLDQPFLTMLYRGCGLYYNLTPDKLLERNLVQAVVCSKIIVTPQLPDMLRKAVISESEFAAVSQFYPSKREVRKLTSQMPAASRRFFRHLSYEAAATALALYTAMANTGAYMDDSAQMMQSMAPMVYLAEESVHTQDSTQKLEYLAENQAISSDADIVYTRLSDMPKAQIDETDTEDLTGSAEEASEGGSVLECVMDDTPAAATIQETSVQESENAHAGYYEIALSHELQDYTRQVCEEYDFPAEYAFAMMFKESAFRPSAVSSTHDYGIMQVNKCNHEWLSEQFGITDFLDEKQNILCGVYMISNAYHKYGDMHKALMAYNMGDKGASKLWAQGIYSSQYSRAIVGYAETLVATGRLP